MNERTKSGLPLNDCANDLTERLQSYQSADQCSDELRTHETLGWRFVSCTRLNEQMSERSSIWTRLSFASKLLCAYLTATVKPALKTLQALKIAANSAKSALQQIFVQRIRCTQRQEVYSLCRLQFAVYTVF